MDYKNILKLIASLSVHPGQDALHAIAAELAATALMARYPSKALASFERHHRGLRSLSDIMMLARQEVARAATAAPLPTHAPDGRWLSIEATAALLRVQAKVIRDRLRTPLGRQSLGWAWWDGHRWLIPEPAVNPVTRASYMAGLPEQEPHTHVALLPLGCER